MVERKRHLAKAVTYRVFGSGATAIIAYIATGDAAVGASIGALDSVVKIGCYYFHERAWYRIKWGIRAPATGDAPAADPAPADAGHTPRVVVLKSDPSVLKPALRTAAASS